MRQSVAAEIAGSADTASGTGRVRSDPSVAEVYQRGARRAFVPPQVGDGEVLAVWVSL